MIIKSTTFLHHITLLRSVVLRPVKSSSSQICAAVWLPSSPCSDRTLEPVASLSFLSGLHNRT